MAKSIFITILCFLVFQTTSLLAGELRVIDGDTIVLDSERHRLIGYDTPEINQKCQNPEIGDGTWPAGRLAKERLIKLIGDNELRCVSKGKDKYGRTLSTCYVGDLNLNEAMVREGWAFVSPQYEQTYAQLAIEAKEKNLGVWRHKCEYPWDFRLTTRLNKKVK